ncbi:MAG: T9SS type A sorting domain-containing protein [Saprospiraceae bacterium]|nr:T9SS type A sorting domain-containing protein [Candidatus Defluviibacterium haderslevense]
MAHTPIEDFGEKLYPGTFYIDSNQLIIPSDFNYNWIYSINGLFINRVNSDIPGLQSAKDLLFRKSESSIYLTINSKLLKSDLGFHHLEVLIASTNTIYGLAIHEGTKRIFYSESDNKRIFSANLDGSDIKEIIYINSGLALIRGIDIDPINNKIYWANTGQGKIQRANLDGTGIEDVIKNITIPNDVIIEANTGNIYWTESGQIASSNTDGSNVKVLVDSTIYSSGFLLLDSIQHYLYWSDPLKGSIEKYDIIANKRIGLISNYHPIYDKQVAYDGLNEILYILSDGFLVKHNPDGSNADKISANAPSNHTNQNIMCLDVLNKWVYYFDINGKLLYRNYAGSKEKEIVKSPDIGRFSASDLIFDGRNSKFYFREDRKIYSMNTNGSDLKLILNNNNNTNIKFVNLDPINNKLYFYDETFVYKMNTDGSGIEPIIKAAITAMTVDPIKERILIAKSPGLYYTDLEGNNEILFTNDTELKSMVYSSERSYLHLSTKNISSTIATDGIILNWIMDDQFNGFASGLLAGEFTIEKKNSKNEWVSIGTTNYIQGIKNYQFADKNLISGKYIYRINYLSSVNKLQSISSNIVVDYVSSVDEITEPALIYYNPIDKNLTYRNLKGQIMIYDLQGKEILVHQVTSDKGTIRLSQLFAGLYHVLYNTSDGFKHIRIFVEN